MEQNRPRAWVRLGLSTFVLASSAPQVFGAEAANAANAANAQDAPEISQLDTVIVTASPTVGGVRKLEASFIATPIDAEKIAQINPRNPADLMTASPGIYAETTGGLAGANIHVSGFPYSPNLFTTLVNGTPLFGGSGLSFVDTTSWVRLDDTVERVEIVQGGPSAVFGPGQMAATANFILRQGSDKPTGSLALTFGSEGSTRVDGFYGFKLAEGWRASVGGFYRSSDGVRDPQFKADEGGQLTATLTHDLDNGSIMLWGRRIDDKTQSFVPVPMIQTGSGKFTSYPGFDALTDTYVGAANRFVTVPTSSGAMAHADMANGRTTDFTLFGVNYEADFGGWQLQDNFLYNHGSNPTNSFISGPNPTTLSAFLSGGNYVPAGATLSASAPLNTEVISQGWWYIQKQMQSAINDLRVSKELFPGNTLTAGLYLARYSSHDDWSLGNQMLMTNTPNATPITLSYLLAGQQYRLTDPQGIYDSNDNYDIKADGWARNTALYLSDSWKTGAWLFDVSARHEHIQQTQQVCNFKKAQLGTAFDLYDNNVGICDGSWTLTAYRKSYTSASVGANYVIAENMSAYVRLNNGSQFPGLDDIRGVGAGTPPPVQTVKNFEGGFKYKSPLVYLDLSIYQRNFDGILYQPTDIHGAPVGSQSTYGSRTKGVNVYGQLTPFQNFRLEVLASYADGHYSKLQACQPYTDINGMPACANFNGNPIQRTPKVMLALTPSYRVSTGWGALTGWLGYQHVGERFADQTALTSLGSYDLLSGGLVADVGPHWELRLQGTNLTNQIALTEGNPRILGANVGANGVILARAFEGRQANFTLKYKF